MDNLNIALVVDAALKGTLVLVAAGGLAVFMRRGSAASRHMVWHLALLAVLGLPLIKALSPMQFPILPQLRSPIVQSAAHADVTSSVTTSSTLSDPQLPTDNAQQFQATQSGPVSATAAAASSTPLAVRAFKWLGIAWLAVAAALLMRLALGFVLVRWFALRAYPLYEDGWAELNSELSALVGLKQDVQLFASPHIATPMTWGVTRAVVMLPSSAEDWTAERKRVVMLHELAHVRRHDSLAHMFAQVACAVYWFHPLVWRAAARMRAEAERACDDLVLATGTKPSVYADHLLELIRTIGGMRTPALALPMAQRSTFEGRLLAILEPHLDRTSPRPLSVAGMVLVVGLVVFPLAGLTTASGLSTENDTRELAGKEKDAGGDKKHASGEGMINGPSVMMDAVTDAAHPDVKYASVPHIEAAVASGAVMPLINALRDRVADVRLAAAESLGQLEDSVAVVALSNALRSDNDARVRKMAAWALGNIECEEGVPALTYALRNDKDVEVRRTATWALGQIEEPAAVPALMDAIRDDDAEVRKVAVWALGQIEDASAVPALAQALRSSDAEVRKQAAWALGQIEDASAVPALAGALRDSDHGVRSQAVWALGQIEDASAVGPLSTMVDDADPDTRKQVAWALGQIEDDASVPALSKMLREDKVVEVRKTAAWALGQIESAAAVPALNAALKDASAEVRKMAAWALGQIEARPVSPALLEALKDAHSEVRSTAAWAIAQIEDPSAAPALRAAMKDSHPEVRKAVIGALVSMGDAVGYEMLAEMLKSDDPEVRASAAAAMGRGRGDYRVDPRPQPRPQPQPKPQPRPIN